jgi:hypothetical protein
MEKKTYRTVILMGEVTKSERKQFEHIENMKFETIEDILEEFGDDAKNIMISELSDFMDSCNNQDITSMEDYWIGYVQLKN